MARTVWVKFGQDREYEIAVPDRELSGSAQSARRWFEQRFVDLGCEPTNPTGKTLLVDKILGVARALGDKSFAEKESSAKEFAQNTLLALERNTVSIDVPALSVR